MKRSIFPTALVLLVGACLLLTSDRVSAGRDPREALYKEQLFELSAYGAGVAAALEGMGKRIALRKEPNRLIADEFNEVFTDHFSGIETSWLRPGPYPERKYLYSLLISRGDHPIAQRFGIGTKAESAIRTQYGTPETATNGVLTYFAPAQLGRVEITFHFRDAVLDQIGWKWPIE